MHRNAYINRQTTPLIVACNSDPLSMLAASREMCADIVQRRIRLHDASRIAILGREIMA